VARRRNRRAGQVPSTPRYPDLSRSRLYVGALEVAADAKRVEVAHARRWFAARLSALLCPADRPPPAAVVVHRQAAEGSA
jgi:hypothetical protein